MFLDKLQRKCRLLRIPTIALGSVIFLLQIVFRVRKWTGALRSAA
jgi:hypothetical protein